MCGVVPDDKLHDQYVVQRPSARASRRKDEFVWYDKMSGEMKKRREIPTVLFLFQLFSGSKVQSRVAKPLKRSDNDLFFLLLSKNCLKL